MDLRGWDNCALFRTGRGPWLAIFIGALLPTLLLVACQRRSPERHVQSQPASVVTPPARDTAAPKKHLLGGEELEEGVVIGKPQIFGNLTVFPVLAKSQPDLGKFTTLPSALEKELAEVREVGDEARGGATVGTLEIENKGKVPIYVLAGTVVKGGKQDRQIAQDFVIDAHSTILVDAFCVERNRWNEDRAGISTNGKFEALKTLATSKVRAAGQYQGNQGEVWEQVGKVNEANKKRAATGTLTATLDDKAVQKEQKTLFRQVTGHLGQVEPSDEVVGFAYAVDDAIKGVRWFANHTIFELFEETLVNTAAVDAITARGGNAPITPPELPPSAVKQFIAELDEVESQRTSETAGDNLNDYAEAEEGYRSETKLKPKSAAAPPAVISKDYVKK